MVVYDKDGAEIDSIYAGYSSTATKEINLKRNKTYYVLCYSKWDKTGDYNFTIKPVTDAGGTKNSHRQLKSTKHINIKLTVQEIKTGTKSN